MPAVRGLCRRPAGRRRRPPVRALRRPPPRRPRARPRRGDGTRGRGDGGTGTARPLAVSAVRAGHRAGRPPDRRVGVRARSRSSAAGCPRAARPHGRLRHARRRHSRPPIRRAPRTVDVLPTLLGQHAEVIDHTNGATYDRRGVLASWRAQLRARDLTYRHEPLATLGDSLELSRVSLSATGVAGGKLDVGAYEVERAAL